MLRKLIIAIFIASVFLALLLPSNSMAERSPGDLFPKIIEKDNRHYFEAKLAGSTYHVPVEYIGDDGFAPSRAGTGMSFTLSLPGLKPIGSKGSSEDWISLAKRNAAITLGVEDLAGTTSHAYRWGVTKKRYSPLAYLGKSHRLYKYRSARGSGGILPADFHIYKEMHLIANPTKTEMALGFSELFVSSKIKVPNIYIKCDGDLAAARPGCNLYFEADNMIFSVNFRKTHLAKWQDIYKNTIARIRSFRVH